jgi:hypothetical protein
MKFVERIPVLQKISRILDLSLENFGSVARHVIYVEDEIGQHESQRMNDRSDSSPIFFFYSARCLKTALRVYLIHYFNPKPQRLKFPKPHSSRLPPFPCQEEAKDARYSGVRHLWTGRRRRSPRRSSPLCGGGQLFPSHLRRLTLRPRVRKGRRLLRSLGSRRGRCPRLRRGAGPRGHLGVTVARPCIRGRGRPLRGARRSWPARCGPSGGRQVY